MVVAATAGCDLKVKGLESKGELTGTFRAPSPRTCPLRRFPVGARPRNAILIIGDGMGPNTVRLASLYQYGRENALQIQQMPVAGLCTTTPLDAPVTESGYDVLVGARSGLKTFRPETNGGNRKDGRDVLAEMERNGYVAVTSQVDFAAVPCGKKTIGFFLEEMQDEESLAESNGSRFRDL